MPPIAYGRVYRPKKSTRGRFAGQPAVVRPKTGRSLQDILDARTTPSSRARAATRYGGERADIGFPRRRLPKPGNNSKRRYF